MKYIHRIILLIGLVLVEHKLFSQTINELKLIHFLRRQQLKGGASNNSSFILPFNNSYNDSNLYKFFIGEVAFNRPKFIEELRVFPILKKDNYTTNHPIEINNEDNPLNVGYQTNIQSGIYIKKGGIEFQTRPKFVFSENKKYETFFTNHDDITWRDYYQWINRIDNPEKFGNDPLSKIFLSNTSLSYNKVGLKLELSNKNMWWGPGYYQTLLMTNNAEGFINLNFSSAKPISFNFGNVEWQFASGLLKNSRIEPIESRRVFKGEFLYNPKPNSRRIFTGGAVSLEPKITPGLFLGFIKASYSYLKNSKSLLDYTSLFGTLGTKVTTAEKNEQKRMMGSVFLKYMMKKDNAEIYAEYGRNDKTLNPLFFLEKEPIPSGLIIGMKKIFPLKNDEFIDFGMEYTNLSLKDIYQIKDIKSWYIDDSVRHGYTNNGKIIGSGLGPGGESQLIEIGLNKGINRIGIQFERRVHNNDFYYYSFERIRDFRRHWVDLITNFEVDLQYKNFLFGGKFTIARTLNYQWFYQEYAPVIDGNSYYKNGLDYMTVQGSLYVHYLLNLKK